MPKGRQAWPPSRFDEEWFYSQDNEYLPVQLTPEILSSVQEIGFRFFPKSGTTTEIYSALDNVKLIPTAAPVDLAVSTIGGEFRLAFTPGHGIACSIEKSGDLTAPGWQPIPGQSGIIGTTEHVFTTPLTATRKFFRVLAEEHFTPFVTRGP